MSPSRGGVRGTAAVLMKPSHVLILAHGDELCSMWDMGISKGMHTDSVAMVTTTQLRTLPN